MLCFSKIITVDSEPNLLIKHTSEQAAKDYNTRVANDMNGGKKMIAIGDVDVTDDQGNPIEGDYIVAAKILNFQVVPE